MSRTYADLIADDRAAVRDMRAVPDPQRCPCDTCTASREVLASVGADRIRRVARERAAEIRREGVGRGSDADLAGDAEAVEIAEIGARFAAHSLGRTEP